MEVSLLAWLFHVLSFRSILANCDDPNDVEKELGRLLKAWESSESTSLGTLRRAIGSTRGKPEYSSGEQCDSGEFLMDLINSVRQDFINMIEIEEEHKMKYEINGNLSNCPLCNHEAGRKISRNNVISLSMPVTKNVLKISALLNSYEDPQRTTEKRCTRCCPHGNSTCPQKEDTCKNYPIVDKRRITSTSNYLMVQLKRFEYNLFGDINKIFSKVEKEENISVNDENFSLKGVIYHYGPYGQGHYVSEIKRGEEWLLMDDEKVSKSSNLREGPVNFQGYIYLYKKEKKESIEEAQGIKNVASITIDDKKGYSPDIDSIEGNSRKMPVELKKIKVIDYKRKKVEILREEETKVKQQHDSIHKSNCSKGELDENPDELLAKHAEKE